MDACRGAGMRLMVVVPLNHLDVTAGVIKVVSRREDAFCEPTVQLLSSDDRARCGCHVSLCCDMDVLLKRADSFMYRSKQRRRISHPC